MKPHLAVLFVLLTILCAGSSTASDQFDRYFKNETCRFDVIHSGTKGAEQFALDNIYAEGPWPGSVNGLRDSLNLGEYRFSIIDAASGAEIYSRGYSTIFNEWQTTDEAIHGTVRAFEESIRFPMPLKKVRIEFYRRDKRMVFNKLFETAFDPSDVGIVREAGKPGVRVVPIVENGAPQQKVDIVVLGDGYTEKEMDQYLADVRHFSDQLFSAEPFKSHKKDFNVRAVCLPSDESGIDQPDRHIWKRTALGTTYNTFGSARYVLTTENKSLRSAAALAPYDFITVLINTPRYGGGGIFQLYATCYARPESQETAWYSDYVYVHEFGHSFGGLGDEYYTSDVPYNDFLQAGIEPWEPNVASDVSRDKLKWRDLVDASTPLPTDWHKQTYDSLATALRTLPRNAADYGKKRRALLEEQDRFLNEHPLKNVVGAFEGAGYASKGLYRPAVNCRMFSKSLIDFDPVCSRAIVRMIDLYTR
ncbi:MAG TPA: M64 family metallopeptidase [Bacteroidota bacterium]|nr:M64 family metallopeptidase [Bacteroidota bacterium]